MNVWVGQLIATAAGIIIIVTTAYIIYWIRNPRPKKDTHRDFHN